MKNYKMIIEYNGSSFKGWQKQENTSDTIQGKMEKALSEITGEVVEIHGAGRTDAGVHAKGQVANFKLKEECDCGTLKTRLNDMLPKTVSVKSLEETEPRFHARLNAKSKTYVYRLWDGADKAIFCEPFVWQCREVTGEIDIDVLNEKLRQFVGEHDFKEFSRYKGNKSTVRTVYEATAARDGDLVTIHFTGNGFLYNQIRMMVGFALTGEKYTAPAKGLMLERVEY